MQPQCELRTHYSARTALPLRIEKFVRHPGGRFRGIIDGDRDDERNRVVHVVAALGGLLPLAAEEPLHPALSARGDNGQKQCAHLDIPLNLFLVKVAALELVSVEPHWQAMGVQTLTSAPTSARSSLA